MIGAETPQGDEFILAGATQDLPDQAVLAPEEKEQYPRARSDGSGERAE